MADKLKLVAAGPGPPLPNVKYVVKLALPGGARELRAFYRGTGAMLVLVLLPRPRDPR